MTPFSIGDLMIGTATAALQIEGGDRNNNWYDWASLPGTIKDGTTPLRATDHWRRWREDTELMATLGLQVYRMGVEWSRIEPRPGEFSSEAIDHYREEIGLLRERGVRPLVTLHHFTNPSWFQGIGEWTHPESVNIWLRFVRRVVTDLGDLVDEWVTLNEPNVYAVMTRLYGEFPPGHKSLPETIKVMRHMAIAHCRAYELIHEIQPHATVGFAHHVRSFDPLHVWDSPMAKINTYLFQDALTDAALGGRFALVLGGQPRQVSPGKYYDYLGINYYTRSAVAGISDRVFPGKPVNDLGWEIYPEGLTRIAQDLHARYPGPIWITENGTADNTEAFRSRYLADHLRVIAESDLPFERYYHWCFVDNFEWAEGEIPRFGIVHNDFDTQERTIKPSGHFLAQVIKDRGVTAEALAQYVVPQRYRLG
ncbi:MAG TPA: family 1 glycosylhydrolase [Marmoricola sp.]|nr:glycoside hydrolase family 1 protein [Nocardioidaceae bacterium]MCB8992725.1 glycoside hydrolase family 1 protein [Nocardioidaceae bacterium]MCO5324140.1 family 1 glycosylhydrolase [Nocardioidaceae bacterium]HRV69827.1 family 1 glycosylhydrolase [Marmoricola sp.]